MVDGGAASVEAADLELLAQIPVFGGLTDDVLARIVGAARLVSVDDGESLIKEGELTVALFVVRDGKLEVCKRARDGEEFCLATLKRGDCVGEMSLIDIEPRSATVRALGAATLWLLDGAAIARLYQTDLEAYTLLTVNIAREISRRLRRANQTLVDLGQALHVTI